MEQLQRVLRKLGKYASYSRCATAPSFEAHGSATWMVRDGERLLQALRARLGMRVVFVVRARVRFERRGGAALGMARRRLRTRCARWPSPAGLSCR